MVYFKGKHKKRGQDMTIKDVEKLTGLTAKSIRYYEDKGLIAVERNKENDYRSYSEEEVNRLKKIKLLRYLEFSVEEVKNMLDMDAKDIQKVLEDKAEDFSDLSARCKDKQDLCLCLAKDYKKSEDELNIVVSEYNEFAETIESDEIVEAREELKFLAAPSFSLSIVQTLMFSGPIMNLFIQISEGKLEDLMLLAGFSILSTILITLIWVFYFTERRKYKKRVKNKNRATNWILPWMIFGIVAGIALFVGINSLVQKLLIPEDFLFYSYSSIALTGMIIIVIFTLFLLAGLLISRLSKDGKERIEKTNGMVAMWNAIGKWKPVVVIVWITFFYCCITSFTVVTKDAIICHSPIHPTGVEYSYSDVEKITAGVGQKTATSVRKERKGQFYYEIEVDGKVILFLNDESSNPKIERYTEHTYLWLEEFDQKLVELGIPKESDSKGYEKIEMDEEYVERFYRILENK